MTQLSKITSSQWIGTQVYHPMFQLGDTPYWRVADYPPKFAEESEEPFLANYDLGVVESWVGDEVTFKTPWGYLHYSAENLWVLDEGESFPFPDSQS